MSMGLGIFLFVVGAILAFAVQDGLTSVVDLTMVGYILMGGGFLTIVIGVALLLKKRKVTTTSRTAADANGSTQVREQESSAPPVL